MVISYFTNKLNEDKEYGIESILYYLYTYINLQDKINIVNYGYMKGIYEYYNLEKPPQKWLEYCIDKRTII